MPQSEEWAPLNKVCYLPMMLDKWGQVLVPEVDDYFREVDGKWRLTNAIRKASFDGVFYRTEKSRDAKTETKAKWGEIVSGVDVGDGWVRVDVRHLQISYKKEFPDGQWVGLLSDCGQKGRIGKMTYLDGGCYQGQWLGGRRHGTGKMVYSEGCYYDGHWQDDKRSGSGYWQSAEATAKSSWEIYDGQWKDDCRHGLGTSKGAKIRRGSTPVDSSREGQWLNDQFIGEAGASDGTTASGAEDSDSEDEDEPLLPYPDEGE